MPTAFIIVIAVLTSAGSLETETLAAFGSCPASLADYQQPLEDDLQAGLILNYDVSCLSFEDAVHAFGRAQE